MSNTTKRHCQGAHTWNKSKGTELWEHRWRTQELEWQLPAFCPSGLGEGRHNKNLPPVGDTTGSFSLTCSRVSLWGIRATNKRGSIGQSGLAPSLPKACQPGRKGSKGRTQRSLMGLKVLLRKDETGWKEANLKCLCRSMFNFGNRMS